MPRIRKRRLCEVCQLRFGVATGPASGKWVDRTCYEYERRTGEERPARLIRDQHERELPELQDRARELGYSS